MTEQQLSVNGSRRQVKQPPSVPFLWEEKPGIPKKDWKPEVAAVNAAPAQLPPPPMPPPLPPPVKLVASVPFTWEEKPGKPLPFLSVTPHDDSLLLLPPIELRSPSSSSDAEDYEADGDDEHEEIFESEYEAFGFETDDSYTSAPSLLANRLMSAVVISTAVPVQKASYNETSNGQTESPSSPASEANSGSTSNYATGTTSLTGSSFLECLFPLFPPKSSFLAKVEAPEEFDRESNSSVIVRRAPTLGELIMMSRRRSCRRKAVQMRKHNLSMVIFQLSLVIGSLQPRTLVCLFY